MKRTLFSLLFALSIILSGCQFFGGENTKTTKAKNPDGTVIKKKHFGNDPTAPVEWKVSVKVNEKRRDDTPWREHKVFQGRKSL